TRRSRSNSVAKNVRTKFAPSALLAPARSASRVFPRTHDRVLGGMHDAPGFRAKFSERNLPMTEPRNRVVQVRRWGGPEELEVLDAPLPLAGRGEVRVRVLAASQEYTEVTIRRHVYPWVRRRPPFVMGYDFVGEIDQLGPGVTGFQLGDRVADMTMI